MTSLVRAPDMTHIDTLTFQCIDFICRSYV